MARIRPSLRRGGEFAHVAKDSPARVPFGYQVIELRTPGGSKLTPTDSVTIAADRKPASCGVIRAPLVTRAFRQQGGPAVRPYGSG